MSRLTSGFTLVEVLVSLMLVAILSGMVLTAVQGVTQNARIARTRSIIAIIDSVLQEQYESYKYRPLAVEIPDLSTSPDGVAIFGFELSPSEAARVRTIMTRDLQRMELPDKISDIAVRINPTTFAMNLPAEIKAVASPVIEVPGPNGPRMRKNPDINARREFPVNWFSGARNVPSRFAGYYRRALPTWTPQHQGSECLYLILSSTFVGGAPAIQSIPATSIGDTDGDGMPEILDGWGRPIEFIRWPSGYQLADSERSIDLSLPDDFDLFRTDFGFTVAAIDPPWSLRPLVVSGGGDGEIGLVLAPLLAGNEVSFRYNSLTLGGWPLMSWPLADMGGDQVGRSNPFIFPDPYLRRVGAVDRPGTPLAGGQSVRADNITNYQLASE